MATVLVVDDDAVYRSVHAHVLEAGGHQVRLADGLAEALDALDDDTYDVLVVDYLLEDGTGLDLLEAVRARGIGSRFVLVTGSSDSEDMTDSRAEFVDQYLTKPARSEALLDSVEPHAVP